MSFGKKNVKDLAERVGFYKKDPERIQICTIHSLAFRHMKAKKEDNMTKALIKNGHESSFFFGTRCLKAVAANRFDELDFKGTEPETDHDMVYKEIMHLRARMLKPADTSYSGYLADEVGRLWKHMDSAIKNGQWDFTYLLEYCVKTGYRPTADFVGVDEIQDCTKLQLEILKNTDAEEIWYVGDPDQSIYGWAGCNIEDIKSLTVDSEHPRSVSYRVPSNIATFADRILDQSSTRTKERIQSKQTGGFIEIIPSFYEVCARLKNDPIRLKKPDLYGETFILARTNYLLGQARKIVEEFSLNLIVDDNTETRARLVALIERPTATLSRDDMELLLSPMVPAEQFFQFGAKKKLHDLIEQTREKKAVLVRDESTEEIREWMEWDRFFSQYATDKLRDVFEKHQTDFLFEDGMEREKHKFNPGLPRVMLYTMHASKGLEADTVIAIATTTERILEHENYDEEVRLAYVAATRAKQNLIVTSLDGTPMRQFPI